MPPTTIDAELVQRLVGAQFAHWARLPVRPVATGGWDNRSFRLGEQLLVRLPSASRYALQVAREHRWLPRLAPQLPLPIPEPLAIGQPGFGYAWKWSIYRWIDGEPASLQRIADLSAFARDLAGFLVALRGVDASRGPRPGRRNFHRGGSLAVYGAQTRKAIAALGSRVDASAASRVWQAALATSWQSPAVWVHGDIAAGNLLVAEGKLSAVIDFGQVCVGDPACDLAIAWTLFTGENRRVFRATLGLDAGTWARARAWALWKALITAAALAETNAVEGRQCSRIIEEVLADHDQERSSA